MDWKYTPNAEFYLSKKAIYDNPDYFNQMSGNVVYPGTSESALGRLDGSAHSDVFLNGQYEEISLEPGTVIDRFGSNGTGRYFSPVGSSFENRALPPFMENELYTKYVVIKPIPKKAGLIAPWFDQPGMGTQYLTDMGVKDLADSGYIVEIK